MAPTTTTPPTETFQAALDKLGPDLSVADLRARLRLKTDPANADLNPSVPHLAQVKFHGDFAAAPADANAQIEVTRQQILHKHGIDYLWELEMREGRHHELNKHRGFDFRLTENETERLQDRGFVVSQRLGAESFAEIYYRLYSDDMPVYVTADSVLHAWHRSFDAFLMDLEVEELSPMIKNVLIRTLSQCRELISSLDAGDWTHTRRTGQGADVNLYLAIAWSLLHGKLCEVSEDNVDRATALWDAIHHQTMIDIEMFGSMRTIDFSIFKPRGHYVKSEKLRLYFLAMMWLGTIDFRVDGSEDPQNDQYQLQCAVLLVHLLRQADALEHISTFEAIVGSLAGDGVGADSVTPAQLDAMLPRQDLLEAYFGDHCTVALTSLQAELARRKLGQQAFAGHVIVESLDAIDRPTKLPVSFCLLGQQFVWSAFVFSKLVFDNVFFDGDKVIRRMPSAVDAGFALFGNDTAGEILAERMEATPKDPGYVPFRDGLPITSNALAVRETVDAAFAKIDPHTSSLSMLWMHALRALSESTPNADPVFHSQSWRRRMLNTQIASFTQLRHDTILYAKQSYTFSTCCEYAAGFVDPYPEFWRRMEHLAARCLELVDKLAFASEKSWRIRRHGHECFSAFVDVTQRLQLISLQQKDHTALSEDDEHFLKSVIEERFGSGGSRYLGWYPSLFYTEREDSGKQDHIVADVHTDSPSVEHGDPGGILHLGVGDVNLGVFVVGNVMYAGPVFSSYEFITPIDERLTDDEFSARVDELSPPSWATSSFLV